MKKRILFLILSVAIPIGSIFAQMAYNHWSIQAKGGINTIRGFQKSAFDRDYNAEFGGAIEYTFTPIIGVGIEYLYQNNDHPSYNFTSNVNQATAFASINLSNLTVKIRKGFWKGFNTYLNVGGGLGYGSYANSATGTTDLSGDVTNLAASFGLNFEYNLGKALALGIEPQFRWNSNGAYNPKNTGSTLPNYQDTKDFYTINLNLRYKIGGSKMHIRNQNYIDYALDQISNTEHQKRQEAATMNMMQQLIQEQAKKDSVVMDSLFKEISKADSISKAAKVDSLAKDTLVASGDYFKKMGQNAGNQNFSSGNASSTNPTTGETTPTGNVENFKTEKHTNTALKQYSVVVGSFVNKENADALSSKLKAEGYEIYVVQNEKGMYRVITHTTNGIESAVSQVKKMRADYTDAWILVLE